MHILLRFRTVRLESRRNELRVSLLHYPQCVDVIMRVALEILTGTANLVIPEIPGITLSQIDLYLESEMTVT